MDEQQSQHKMGISHAEMGNAIYMTLHVLSTCITPLTRTGFGTEALGFNGLFAFILLVCLSGSVPGMNGYFLLWLFALVMQRLSTFNSRRLGLVVHSRYGGYPWLAARFLKERRASPIAFVIEFLVMLAIGGGIYLSLPLLGQFLMVCAVALILKYLLDKAIDQKRIQRMRDAEIEQRWYSEQYRKGLK